MLRGSSCVTLLSTPPFHSPSSEPFLPKRKHARYGATARSSERKQHQETASKLAEATMQITVLQQELATATKRIEEMRAKAADPVVTGAAESSNRPGPQPGRARARASIAVR
jgi:hypothetical protein